MKKQLYKIWARILTIFGDIKLFKWPLWVVYDPSYFKMSGEKILEVIDILKPGDVILRGFDCYADGHFIDDPLKFSHGAIYIGNNTIIHAVAEGVSEINVIEFCECDRIAILRPRRGQKKAISIAIDYLDSHTPYDFNFEFGESAVQCFELCRLCYPKLDIQPKQVSKMFGLIKKNVYLAQSLFESDDFICVFHYNPKFGIDESN